MKIQSDNRQAADAAAAAKAKADAAAEAQAQEDAARERKEDEDRQEREDRTASVAEIEAAIKKLAEQHVKDDLIDGPVIDVSCVPVAGGSTDDLSQRTTTFECFTSTKDNGDGTMSGHYYSATMNWDSGEYTYRLGR